MLKSVLSDKCYQTLGILLWRLECKNDTLDEQSGVKAKKYIFTLTDASNL